MFKKVKAADNKRAAFDSYVLNLTKEGTILEDWLVVGKSKGNSN
jgi:hypothetical protein